MVKIISRGKEYTYENKTMETVFIDKKIKEDFAKFCKEHKIVKSRLIEELYKQALLKFRTGSLNNTQGYITIKLI